MVKLSSLAVVVRDHGMRCRPSIPDTDWRYERELMRTILLDRALQGMHAVEGAATSTRSNLDTGLSFRRLDQNPNRPRNSTRQAIV